MTYTKEREDEINRAYALLCDAYEKGEIEEQHKESLYQRWYRLSAGLIDLSGDKASHNYRAKPALLEGYVNVYPDDTDSFFPTKEDAEAAARSNTTRVAVKVMEVE